MKCNAMPASNKISNTQKIYSILKMVKEFFFVFAHRSYVLGMDCHPLHILKYALKQQKVFITLLCKFKNLSIY